MAPRILELLFGQGVLRRALRAERDNVAAQGVGGSMTAEVAQNRTAAVGAGRSGGSAKSKKAGSGLDLLLPALAGTILLAWALSRVGGYTPGSDLGYALGVAGGIAMLVVFLYPFRKRLASMRTWGPMKVWFAVHMACGVLGPLLILMHTTFHIGSVNAGVALVCMVVVALSGIVGRFIYTRIHHGLYGAQASFNELQAMAGLKSAEVRSRLAFAPSVEKLIRTFEAEVLPRPRGMLSGAWAFMTLGRRAWWTRIKCGRELAIVLRAHAAGKGWDEAKYRRERRRAMQLVHAYLEAAQSVAQFSRYERLFSLWHVLHVPFVWLMVLSAVAHVVAVHAY